MSDTEERAGLGALDWIVIIAATAALISLVVWAFQPAVAPVESVPVTEGA